MALTSGLVKRNHVGGRLTISIAFVFSGTYATGGEAFDFATIAGFTTKQPDNVSLSGISGFILMYSHSDRKIIIYGQSPTTGTAGTIGLAELAAGAYPSEITAVTFRGMATWIR